MKAEFNGIVLEGDPKEIAEVLKTLEIAREVRTIIKEIPVYPTHPIYPPIPNPLYPPSGPYWITCSGYAAGTAPTPGLGTTQLPPFKTPETTAG